MKFRLSVILAFILALGLTTPIPVQALEKQTELIIPAAANPGLRHLLDLADPAKNVSFDSRMVAAVMEFVETPKAAEALYFPEILRDLTSAYYDFDIQKSLKTIVDYAFNPEIPAVATTPSSARLFKYMDSGGKPQAHPQVGQYLHNINSPVVLRGRQFVEITPDLTSGAYYGYHLNQTLIVFKYRNHRVLITISKQMDISNVGKKGYILGSDRDWDYFYSGQIGLTLPALGWVKSYMYDSWGINIYTEIDPDLPRVRCAAFKWLRAGWSGINLVQKKHIYRGLKRFAATYKEIMESPLLPPADQLAIDFARIRGLSQDALRSKMDIYSKILKNRYGSGRQDSHKWRSKLFEDKDHWHRMSEDEMESVLSIEYMKNILRKNQSVDVGKLLVWR